MPADGILSLSRRLHEARTLAELMDEVVTSVSAHTRYARAWLLLPMTGRLGLDVVGYALPDRVRVEQRMADHDRTTDRLLSWLLSTTETVVIDDLRLEPRADQDQVAYFGNRTSINVPMLRLDERLGVLVVGTFAGEGVVPPTQAELAFIEQVAALVTAVAARIRAEAAQHAAEDRVRAAQRLEALGRMAGEVAHDFNSMLVSIMCNAELALEQLGGHAAAESVAEILLAADRAAALTKKLLTFSRGQPVVRRLLDVGEALETFLPIVRSLLPEGLRLVSELPRGAYVQGDASQLEQVVMNLVINARDALPDGGEIRLTLGRETIVADDLTIRTSARAGDFVVIVVADTGLGMSREVAERVFEPFFTTKGVGRGTGLGLAVVDSVVRMHEGFVELDSVEGRGTTFRVYLPAREAPTSLELAATPPLAPVATGHGHVLVVDDDAQLRGVIERVLTGAGYRVTCASDGQAALERVETSPDLRLVITDLIMPRLTGDALRERLSALRPHLPVLILTGYTRGSLPPTDGQHLLSKPFVPRELLQKVAEILAAPTSTPAS
jgi:two-component system cell cycle sensor histidine kinase/response regulator CckA